MKTRDQFVEIERLEQIVVRPGTQPGDAIFHRVTCGQHQHRQGHVIRAPALQQTHAILVGQTEIENHHVTMHCRQRGLGLRCGFHTVHCQAARTQAGLDAVGNQIIIFNQQYPHKLFSVPGTI